MIQWPHDLMKTTLWVLVIAIVLRSMFRKRRRSESNSNDTYSGGVDSTGCDEGGGSDGGSCD